jgi:NADPH-dependent 2,4-dienoyl-CoA reductase/sulfur reductase-like enzyme/Fe-S-cluster-containing hydrogenase component 2
VRPVEGSLLKTEIAVVGAGPAGLAAAIEAARAGAQVILIDENARPGGQLFKQIHKFFGSEAHRAGVRGVQIGQDLLQEAREASVEIRLNTVAYGLFEDKCLALVCGDHTENLQADAVILATGANENALAFPGWTLPGVMGAGAAQTLINIHRTLPGRRVLMIGAGNVGLIVTYQLLQAGAEVVAIVEGLPHIGGYGVHASKVRRAGVPIFTHHTILRAEGEESVERAVIAQVDENWQPLPGIERILEVDTICLAVGLSPLTELPWMAGAQLVHIPVLGGWVPAHDEDMRTNLPGIYIAGDLAGIEEASTAMEEGRLAGLAAAEALGYLSPEEGAKRKAGVRERLASLRIGSFGEGRAVAKEQIVRGEAQGMNTQACPEPALSEACPERGRRACPERGRRACPEPRRRVEGPSRRGGILTTGIPSPEELEASPGYPSTEDLARGPIVVIECVQDIPCNPCEAACPNGAVFVGNPITNLPVFYAERCDACGRCVPICPGQAIFRVDMTYSNDKATVAFPYEFLPMPEKGDIVQGVNRAGEVVCEAEVLRVQRPKGFDHTAVVTIAVPKELAMEVRSMKRLPQRLRQESER